MSIDRPAFWSQVCFRNDSFTRCWSFPHRPIMIWWFTQVAGEQIYIVWKFPPVVWMILICCHRWRDHSGCDKEEVSLLTSLFSYRFHRGVPLGWIRKGDAGSATCHRIFELDYNILVTRLLGRGTRLLNYECSIKSKFNWTLCWLIHHHRLTFDSNKPSMRT